MAWSGMVAEQIISGKATLKSLSSVAKGMEKEGLFDGAKVPSLDYETMARIRGEIQFDLVRKIEEELRRQGLAA
jgi:hypothetical protein